MNDDLIHKRKPPSLNGLGPRSMCGRYGYVTAMWRSVTCDVCLAMREKRKRR